MKKAVLVSLLILLITANPSFADDVKKDENIPPNFNQKSCQNIFSIINVDFSAFSPRGSATDVLIREENKFAGRRRVPEMPVSNEVIKPNNTKQQQINLQDNTSFFRLDLLKLIKIRIF